MVRKKLSKGQLNRASEVAGNISVAWFTVGAITPLFTPLTEMFDFIFKFIVSLLMFIFFFTYSLILAKKGEK